MNSVGKNHVNHFLKKFRVFFMICLAALSISSISWAAEYYVDGSKGDDSNSGSIESPWKTIGMANSTLEAGDTVFIRGGTYKETIRPINSGTSSASISFSSYNNETVMITKVGEAIDLSNRAYVTVNDIDAEYVDMYVNLDSGHNNLIQYCTFDKNTNSDSTPTGISMEDNSHHNWIYHVMAGNVGKSVSGEDKGGVVSLGNNTGKDTSNYNLFENCTFYNGGHHVLILRSGHNIFRNNHWWHVKWMNENTVGNRIIGGNASQGYGDWNVFEGNKFTYSSMPPDANYASEVKYALSNSIVRNNLFYNANSCGLKFSVYGGDDRYSDNHRVYHNVFFHNGYRSQSSSRMHGLAFCSYESVPNIAMGTAIRNNIFFDNKGGSISYIIDGRDSSANHIIGINWWDDSGNPKFVDTTLPEDPSNATLPNLQLQDTSPCIDAGEFLTGITSSSGSGTSFQVDDASYFIDGWGIVEGDTIQLEGEVTKLKITNINYDNNTITIDQSISWQKGQGVSLPYSGSAPDLGAFEYDPDDSSQLPIALEPPFNLRIF